MDERALPRTTRRAPCPRPRDRSAPARAAMPDRAGRAAPGRGRSGGPRGSRAGMLSGGLRRQAAPGAACQTGRLRSALMYGRVVGVTVLGVGGHPVAVEAFVGRGLPSLVVTGLPGATVQDGRERIRPAVEHAGLRVAAPPDRGQPGAGQPPQGGSRSRPARGRRGPRRRPPRCRLRRPSASSSSASCRSRATCSPPPASSRWRSRPRRSAADRSPSCRPRTQRRPRRSPGCGWCPPRRSADVAGFLRGTWNPPAVDATPPPAETGGEVDLAEVRGQAQARRALEVAAAGGHNVLMVGSPGRRQDHAGPPPPHHPARAHPRRSARGDAAPFGRRAAATVGGS